MPDSEQPDGSLAEKQAHHGTKKDFTEGGRSRVTVDTLPDVALPRIFDFYLHEGQIEDWYPLVHVCQTWRELVFDSPRRLNLRLPCTPDIPVRETLDVWPLLPLAIFGLVDEMRDEDNTIAALAHHDRICELRLSGIPSRKLEQVSGALQQPFPELTHLKFGIEGRTTHVFPDSFLGGYAPRLRTVLLCRVPFPGLPKFLMSATRLVRLHLWRIPDSGYFSPEEMVTSLSVLTRLESLIIKFESSRHRPDWESRRPPPPTGTILPVLKRLRFKGTVDYMEDLVARIDAPGLDKLAIFFFQRPTFDNNPQVTQFISRTPKFKTHNKARLHFYDRDVWAMISQISDGELKLGMSCIPSNQRLSSLAQLYRSSLPKAHISAVESLYIDGFQRLWQNVNDNSQWLEFLHPFIAVKCLYISLGFATRVVPALQELVGARERAREVLPALGTLFLEEPLPSWLGVQEAIQQFVAAQQLSSHPVVVSYWDGRRFE